MAEQSQRPSSSAIYRRIQENTIRHATSHEVQQTNFFIERTILPTHHIVHARHQEIRLERDTVVVFADDAPLFNWAHPCRYLLHDADTGELYRTVQAGFPPYLNEADTPRAYQAFHLPVRQAISQVYAIKPELVIRYPFWKQQRYAVLFAGDANNRHTNDLEFLWRTLRDVYGVPANNIYVLNHDGSINYNGDPKPVGNWPGDNTAYRMPVHAEGSKSELDNVFDDLKSRLDPEDSLLIHTNNHGYHNGTVSMLCCRDGADYAADDFGAKLAELPEFRCLIVMMEQCNSGGFNSHIINNSTAQFTSVSSAAREDRSSIGGPNFDPFARDWIAAMTGANPNGSNLVSDPDTNHNSCVSAREAHNYADAVKDPYDTPVYSETSWAAGNCHLGTAWNSLFVPPIYLEVIRLFDPIWWREEPERFYAQVQDMLPQLAEAAAEFEPDVRSLQNRIEKHAEELVRRGMGTRRSEK